MRLHASYQCCHSRQLNAGHRCQYTARNNCHTAATVQGSAGRSKMLRNVTADLLLGEQRDLVRDPNGSL
jgi:hypothetical protein